jgi:heme-degrading monooxygenase HmoA
MFARVSRLTGSPDRIDEVVRIAREQVVPAAKKMNGFKGMYAMVDRQSGATLSFTLWESEEAMRASETDADRLRSDAAASGGASIASVERYEIVVQPD